MTFSTNQNRHMYVAKRFVDGTSITALAQVGDLKVASVGDIDKQMYFQYQGPAGVIKSDYIPVKNISYVKAQKASKLGYGLKKVELTLASAVNGGAPIGGQDYVLRIAFRQFYGMGEEDQYFKDAAVHATTGMSASDFYKAMVTALNKAFSREVGATASSNPYLSFSVDNNSTATKIIIEEKEQDWTLGIGAVERVYFDVQPTTVYSGGDDVIWGTVAEVSPTTVIGNGKLIADLEYFCMGERGDIYRNVGWPNVIPTTYVVDPAQTYNVLEIHYSFTDTGVNSYKSEKDLTIAVPMGAASHEYDVINDIIDEIESVTGLTIAGLS